MVQDSPCWRCIPSPHCIILVSIITKASEQDSAGFDWMSHRDQAHTHTICLKITVAWKLLWNCWFVVQDNTCWRHIPILYMLYESWFDNDWVYGVRSHRIWLGVTLDRAQHPHHLPQTCSNWIGPWNHWFVVRGNPWTSYPKPTLHEPWYTKDWG